MEYVKATEIDSEQITTLVKDTIQKIVKRANENKTNR